MTIAGLGAAGAGLGRRDDSRPWSGRRDDSRP